MPEEYWKVGDLARRTGLSVRTLHHYHEIGLLVPAARTASGHRLYGGEELARLHRITTLRHLGLSLDQIAAFLDQESSSLEDVLELQLQRLDAVLEETRTLRDRVAEMRARVASEGEVSADELTAMIQWTVTLERYYEPAQLRTLASRRESLGDAHLAEKEQEWSEVMATFGKAMERGLAPSHPAVLDLAARAAGLVEEFTGGDPAMRESLVRMYREEGPDQVFGGHGAAFAPGLWEYIQAAGAALRATGTAANERG
ncbi:MAG: MerR family transcriptional regulator [Gemmatimonadota bacterium]|nr:MerR family transcriptional regulator [Gemmatimonadota bacterium]MDH5759605.1 MerR family transcriptional regulator [Gemmatimonadota bacterium]